MIEQVMRVCNNWFARFREMGTYTISANKMIIKGRYLAGQYIRIIGSGLNDGVYKIKSVNNKTLETVDTLQDETFEGNIVCLYPPGAFINLVNEISEYEIKNPIRGVASESVPNYSVTYNKGIDGNQGWQSIYAPKLKGWTLLPKPTNEWLKGVFNIDQ